MHASFGLRIARVHSPLLRHGHGHGRMSTRALAPLFPASASRSRITSYSNSSLRRDASTSTSTSAAPQAKDPNQKQQPPPPKSAPELVSSQRLTTPLSASSTLNPPASTRPPPLSLPVRAPSSSLFMHLFHLGKAYTSFYKTGLRAIFANYRLLSAAPPSLSATSTSASTSMPLATFPTRADALLRARVRHDLSRLPLFGLLVLVCGEFTPLLVLVFPRLTPYTCRIPKQMDALRRRAEARRAASFRALRAGSPDEHGLRRLAPGHVCRSLDLTSAVWDKIGLDGPFAAARARRAVARIAADDGMIRGGGGVRALVDDEVVLACEERGMDVRGEDAGSLRARLEDWLRKTAPGRQASGLGAEAEDKIKAMLLGLDETL